jgi:hypothetical protein
VTQGSDAALTVSATGAEPLRYQWNFNGKRIEGTTNATLTLSRVSIGQAGDYSVEVCNDVGCVLSSVARLTVQAAPLYLHSPWKSSDMFGFNVDCSSELSFVIETSTDLQHWAGISTNSGPAIGLPLSFPVATDGLPRFFRVRSTGDLED